VVVAKHRRSVELVDPKLRTFDRLDWEKEGDGYFDAFRRWKRARAEWVAKHPDSMALGGKLERFQVEFQTQMSLYDPDAASWADYER
jgi:hypothetical protein